MAISGKLKFLPAWPSRTVTDLSLCPPRYCNARKTISANHRQARWHCDDALDRFVADYGVVNNNGSYDLLRFRESRDLTRLPYPTLMPTGP